MARNAVLRFAEAMELRLRANAAKGGWHNEPITWLFLRMREELGELEGALCRYDHDAVRQECADVANFAMMICENLAADEVS